MFWKKPVRDRFVPLVCIAAPLLSWVLQWCLREWTGYETSFELLVTAVFSSQLVTPSLCLSPMSLM